MKYPSPQYHEPNYWDVNLRFTINQRFQIHYFNEIHTALDFDKEYQLNILKFPQM